MRTVRTLVLASMVTVFVIMANVFFININRCHRILNSTCLGIQWVESRLSEKNSILNNANNETANKITPHAPNKKSVSEVIAIIGIIIGILSGLVAIYEFWIKK